MRLGVPLAEPAEGPGADDATTVDTGSLPHRGSADKRDKRRTLAGVLPVVGWPVLAALLSVVVWQPFVRLDFDLWRTDDGEYHLLRVYVFEWAVRAGEWLPRWTPDLFVGFGYPIFNFYAPGTYYLAMLLRLGGWDVYTTVQALGVVATCGGATGAYCLARAVFGGERLEAVAGRAPRTPSPTLSRWRGVLAGLVAALGFVYAPYPFSTNLLIRADLAEALGLALLPWALLGAWQAGRRPGAVSAAGLALGLGAVVLTHNLTALITLPAAAVVGLFAAWQRGAPRAVRGRAVATVLGALGLGLALTAFFWLPALLEQRHVQIEVALDGGHKSARAWLIDPLGATDATRRGGNPQTVYGPLDLHLSYPYDLNYPPKPSLGQGVLFAVTLVLLLAGIARRWAGGRRPPGGGATEGGGVTAPAVLFGAGTLLLWFLTTTWSAWAWEHVPLMRFLQFSWRLYGPLALALGLAAAGAAAMWLEGRPRRRWIPFLAGAPLLAGVLLAVNTTTARPLWLDHNVERRVGGPQLVGTENATFGAGTTTGGEFVPRTVDLEALGPGKRRGNGVYERLYPEFGWLAGRAWVLEGRLRVDALSGGPTWTEAEVEAETPGVLAFRTVAFPGWRAYVDGREVAARLAPWDESLEISPGFLTVPVPAGAHRVQIAFGPTRLRTLSGAVSVVALALLGWWLVAPRRGGTSSDLPPGSHVLGLTPPPPAPGSARPGLGHTQGARPGPAWAVPAALLPAAVMVLAYTHDVLRPALGAPAAPRAGDARIVADVIELARSGTAVASSPSGEGLGPFVALQRLAVGSRERRWLYMHPPASLSTILVLPERAAFQAGLALDPRTWGAEGADGVRFVLEVTPDGGETVRVLDEHVNPRARDEQRAWLDRWVDLSAFGGRRVQLTLRTEGAQTPDFDWAGWADPVVFVQREARRPGGGPPAPLPTPRAS